MTHKKEKKKEKNGTKTKIGSMKTTKMILIRSFQRQMLLLLLFATVVVRSQNNCTLCMDGTAPPNPDLVIPSAASKTCGELDVVARSTPPDDANFQCYDHYFKGDLCGCVSNSPPEDGCEFCDGNLPLPFPDRTTNPEDIRPGLWQCKIEHKYGLYNVKEGTDACATKKSSTGVICGCQTDPPHELKCPLCPDPSMFVNLASILPPPNPTLDLLLPRDEQMSTCFNTQFYWDMFMDTGVDPYGVPFNQTTCDDNLRYMSETYGNYSDLCCVKRSTYFSNTTAADEDDTTANTTAADEDDTTASGAVAQLCDFPSSTSVFIIALPSIIGILTGLY